MDFGARAVPILVESYRQAATFPGTAPMHRSLGDPRVRFASPSSCSRAWYSLSNPPRSAQHDRTAATALYHHVQNVLV